MPSRPAPAVDSIDTPICPHCGYNLRGLSSDRCPECGAVFDLLAMSQSQLPWGQRRRLGRVRAYLRTWWLAVASMRRLGLEVARPVEFSDARWFRIVTLTLTFVPLCALMLAAQATLKHAGVAPFDIRSGPLPWEADLLLPWWAATRLWVVLPVGLLLFVIGWTGLASYLFHPRWLPVLQQNRAVTLSYYACAPLALLGVCVALITLLWAFDDFKWVDEFPAFIAVDLRKMLLWGLSALSLFMWWINTLRLLHQTTHCGAGRIVIAAFGLPVMTALLACLTMVILPWIAGFLLLMALSLTG